MLKKLICLAFVLGLVTSASASLEGYWPLDGNFIDGSGLGRDGTFVPADPNNEPNFVEGVVGQALDLTGVNDYVNIDGYKGILQTGGVTPAFSIANWMKTTDTGGNNEMVTWGINGSARRLTWRVHGGGLRTEHSSGNLRGRTVVNDGEWHHVALTAIDNARLRPGDVHFYIDGVEETDYFSGSDNRYNLTAGPDVSIGRRADNNSRHFPGVLDEVMIFSRTLAPEEVTEIMNGTIPPWPFASNLSPANNSIVEADPVVLSWRAGETAESHDVYVGTTADLGPDQLVSQQTETEYAVDVDLDTMYYWRIDEVESADVVHAGEVQSFYVPPMAAYDLSPADGTADALTSEISWTGGWSPLMHAVYVSTSASDVANGLVEPTIIIRGDTSLDIGPLDLGTTYYWAVDELYADHWSVGETQSFTTAPDVPADPNADPNLVAHWKFDEGMGSTALDSSGNNYHALLIGDVNWVASGADGDDPGTALSFAEAGQYGAISGLNYETTGIPEVSVFAWIRTAKEGDQYILSYDRNEYYRLEINGLGAGPGQIGWDVMTDAGQIDYGSETRVDDDEWHHVGGVFDNGTATIYIDGQAEPSVTMGTTMGTGTLRYGLIASNSEASSFDGNNSGGDQVDFLDDLRIYDRAFSAADIRQTFSNAAAASNPDPPDGATGLSTIVTLTWLDGDGAVSHDVHLGTDAAAVAAGDAFAGNVVSQPVILGFGLPPDPFVGGLTPGTTYYWRIDEIDADGNVTPGPVWSFSL